MDQLTSNIPFLVFFAIGTIAVASSVLVISMRNPVHSALFLLLSFICVAVLFMMKEAEFVATVQVLVYAGGIMVLFLFVIMLINVRHLPEDKVVSPMWLGGIGIGIGVFILLATVVRPGTYHDPVGRDARLRTSYEHRVRVRKDGHGKVISRERYRRGAEVGNSEAVGMALYTDYLVPFEIASLFLLVAMIGAIVIGKRELNAADEDSSPQYMLDRVETEKEVKEAMSA
jgi:NADH-quinone oxidoreductase subunit J